MLRFQALMKGKSYLTLKTLESGSEVNQSKATIKPRSWSSISHTDSASHIRIVLGGYYYLLWGFPGGAESACQWKRSQRCRFNPWVRKIPWRTKWQLAPVFLPGELHVQRSLVGDNPWGHRVEHDSARMHTHSLYLLCTLFFLYKYSTCNKKFKIYGKIRKCVSWLI